ncbi:MAG TPA: hypothetical protein VIV40_42155 [Kofleriaceae bacterium]
MRKTLLVLLTGCTTLGPMPATTGVSAVPINRPGGEVQVGPVPGFFLSSSAHAKGEGAPIMQLAALIEPDRWFKLPGLVVGARLFGQSGDTPGEPYIGYRHTVRKDLSIGGGLYGTSKSSTSKLASYKATRIGGEAALDAQMWESEWFGFHLQAAVTATRIKASGEYCVDAMGIAKDCNVEDPTMNMLINGEQTGVYPAATGTLALDVAKGRDGVFDGARLALMFATGSMPLMKDGEKTGNDTYAAAGLTLTLGIADD